MKRRIIVVVGLVAVAIAIVWHGARATDPHYTGGTVAANRGNLVIDPILEIARGHVAGARAVSVVGRNIEIDDTVVADIYDMGSTGLQLIWLAPTAARAHTVVSTDAVDVTSSGELTLTGQPANTNTCTIGTKVYTFQTVLTNVDGNVKIGADAEGTIDNLVAAVNLAAGAGTNYAALMTANAANVVAVKTAADDFTIYTVASTAIATTDTMANATWAAGTTTLGTGARTLRVTGLTDWDTAEVSEDISLRGLSGVALTNSYVMINRMEVLTKGATTNAGTISATAATDATVSAYMIIGTGETNMAIYGIPSVQTAYIGGYYASANEAGGAAGLANVSLLVNPEPDAVTTSFTTKRTFGLISAGLNDAQYMRTYVPLKVPGPAIIKMQGLGGADDMDVTAGFDLILVNN